MSSYCRTVRKCKRKKRKNCEYFKKIGIAMMALGIMTICAFFLPIQAWLVLLGIALIVFGIKLIK